MTHAVTRNRKSRNSASRQGSEIAFLGMVAFPITSRPYKHCRREEFNGVAIVAPFSKAAFCSARQLSVLPTLWSGLKLSYVS